jgi:hypothetical protein
LYFERTEKSQICFGYRFLHENREISESVYKKLNDCRKYVDDEIPFSNLDRNRLSQLQLLYNAMSLWLSDSRILQQSFVLQTLPHDFCTGHLFSCIQGIEYCRHHLWLDLVPSCNDLISKLVDLSPVFNNTASQPPESIYALPKTALQSPQTAPNYTRRSPLLESVEEFTFANYLKECSKTFDSFQEKSILFDSTMKNLGSFNTEYLGQLKRLYTVTPVKNTVRKSCSKNCKGQAIFDFYINKIVSDSELKLLIGETKFKIDSISETDYADTRLCLAGLKALFLVEWIESQILVSKEWKEKLEALFYTILRKLDFSIFEFSPAFYITQLLLASIAKKTLTDPKDILNLWSNVKSECIAISIAEFYHPYNAPENFADLYRELLQRHFLLGDIATHHLITQFDVSKWLSKVQDQEKIRHFLSLLINFPKLERESAMTFNANRMLLHATLKIQTSKPLALEAATLCLENVLTGNGYPDILQEAVNSMFPAKPDNYKSFLKSFELVDCSFSRAELVKLLLDQLQMISNLIYKKSKSPLSIQHTGIQNVFDMYILLFCAQPLFGVMIELHFQELLQLSKQIILSLLGIILLEGKWNCLQPCLDTPDNISAALEVFSGIFYKICKQNATPQLYDSTIWDLISSIMDSNAPSELCAIVIQSFESHEWVHFCISDAVIAEIVKWKQDSDWTPAVAKLFIRMISNAKLDIVTPGHQLKNQVLYSNSNLYVLEFIRIIFDIVRDSEIYYPDRDARSNAFQIIKYCISGISWKSIMSENDFKSVISCLPSIWPITNVRLSSLTYSSVSPDPISFSCELLLILGQIRQNGPLNYMVLYLEYVVGLLSTDLTRDKGPVTLDTEYVPDIISDLLAFAEKFKVEVSATSKLKDLVLSSLIQLMNHIDKEHVSFLLLKNGILKGVQATLFPMDYLDCSIQFLLVEFMAEYIEKTIERQIVVSHENAFKSISAHLIVPEMFTERFVKACLENAYLLTLYATAFQKLQVCKSLESRILIGEQISYWISNFKVDRMETGKEGKLACLLYQFGELLSMELKNLPILNHSKLQSHVPSLANYLLKWSEDRISGGLWATLGFGPKAKSSIDFRFFARGVGTFMASRCLPIDSPERKKLIASVELLHSNSDYESLLLYLDPLMDEFLLDESKGIESLPHLIIHQTKALFPEYLVND